MTRKTFRKWFTRKIRKGGRVKIAGHWFKPSSRWDSLLPYDGRLDGLTAVFATYHNAYDTDYKPVIEYHHTEGFDFDNDPKWVNSMHIWQWWRCDE